MAQITSFSQLSEVQITEWAARTSQFLVERYSANANDDSCQTLNSDEFAVSLNAYCDRLSEHPIFFNNSGNPTNLGTESWQPEFAAKLAYLDAKIDALEASTTKLKGQYFGTTSLSIGEPVSYFKGELGIQRETGDWGMGENFFTGFEPSAIPVSVPSPQPWSGYSFEFDRSDMDGECWAQPVAERVVTRTEITLAQIFDNGDRVNIRLFCTNSHSAENIGFHATDAIVVEPLTNNSWGLQTDYRLSRSFEWHGFSSNKPVSN